jgi:membrane protein
VTAPPALTRAWDTAADYVARTWNASAEDGIFFLAGGIAFNILLAAIPFFLLLVTVLAYFFGLSASASSAEAVALIDRLLPQHVDRAESPVHAILTEIIRARGRTSIVSAIIFVWFSTRLFGSLRTVLADVFDIEQERGIIAGKLFDIQITIVSTFLFVFYTAISAYLAFATSRGAAALEEFGFATDVMGRVEYTIGRLIAFAFIALMFYALYKFLPRRRIRSESALVGALFTAVMFEVARNVFNLVVRTFNPGTLYTGTLAALVIIVAWVYYAALIFILGGEVGQVHHLRYVWRTQRAALD